MTKKALAIVKLYIKGWIEHDPHKIWSCFHENGVYIDPLIDTELIGDQIKTHAEKYFTAFPDLSFEGVGSINESNGLYAAQWIMRGTSSILKTSASGKVISIALPGADFIRTDQDKILSVQAYYDHRAIPFSMLAIRDNKKWKSRLPDENRHTRSEQIIEAKYTKSALSSDKSNQLKLKILRFMKNEEAYLDSNFSLLQLANALGQSTNNVSQAINTEMKQNFNDMVNTYRIEMAKRLLQNRTKNQKSILEIAFEVGFASKSTFNLVFKKHTGMSPSQISSADTR